MGRKTWTNPPSTDSSTTKTLEKYKIPVAI